MCGATATLSTTLVQPSAPKADYLVSALSKQVSQKLAVEYTGSSINASVSSAKLPQFPLSLCPAHLQVPFTTVIEQQDVFG